MRLTSPEHWDGQEMVRAGLNLMNTSQEGTKQLGGPRWSD